jgi:hypothetical protein
LSIPKGYVSLNNFINSAGVSEDEVWELYNAQLIEGFFDDDGNIFLNGQAALTAFDVLRNLRASQELEPRAEGFEQEPEAETESGAELADNHTESQENDPGVNSHRDIAQPQKVRVAPTGVVTFLLISGWVVIVGPAFIGLMLMGKTNSAWSGLMTAGPGFVSGAVLIGFSQGLHYLQAIHYEILQRNVED